MPDVNNIETILKDLQDTAAGLKEKVAEMDAARRDIMERLDNDNLVTKADLARDLKKVTDDMAGIMKEQAEVAAAIDELKATLANPVAQATDPEADETVRKEATEFLRDMIAFKAYERGDDYSQVMEQVGSHDVDVKAYVNFKAAFDKFMHAPQDPFRTGLLTADEVKALSTFTASGNSFFVSPQLATQMLSCLEEPYQIAGIFGQVQISKAALKIPVDDVEAEAAWACETDCFANAGNTDGLSEKEIPANTLRWVACVTRDLLDDAAVNVQDWIAMKGRDAFTRAIERGIVTGDGKGMPLGFANARSCIPRMTAKAESDGGAPAGGFTWADLVMLRNAIHAQYYGPDMAFIMSQDALGMTLTMSDGNGRPIYEGVLSQDYRPRIMGTPVYVSSYLPGFSTPNGFATGATPVAVGNWRRAYTIVRRKALSVQRDDYSAGFCVLFKFESRVGGDVTCCNAARILVTN